MPRDATPSTASDQGKLRQLVELVRQRRHAHAEALARQCIHHGSAPAAVWQALGAALHGQGRLAEAIEAQRQATRLAPQDAVAHYLLGESLLAARQPASAAESYRRACGIKPDFVQAQVKLGHALALQQRFDEAIDAYRDALRTRPDFGEAHAHLGLALMSIGRHAEAEPHLRRALPAQPGSVPLHHALGVVLYGQARMDEAAACFRQVVTLAPGDAEAHANLGNALRELGQWEAAEASYRRALALDDRFARGYFELGGLMYLQGRFAEAEQHYRHALALKPGYVDACNNLGRSVRRQGRLDEAREYFATAMAMDPESVETYCNMAALRRFTPEDMEPAQLEKLACKLPSLSGHLRIRYWFSLGKMREDLGRYDDAFAAYAEGNRLKHAQLSPDEGPKIALIERVRSCFDASFFASHAPSGVGPSGRTPVFIVGMPRSGTSLIEQILATHPQVHGAGELPELEDLLLELAATAGKPLEAYPDIAARMTTAELLRLGEAYMGRVWRLAPQAALITDKMMSNFHHLGMIHTMLPGAKIIHAMRDPMDSCFSCYATLFSRNNLDFTYDLGELGRYYVRYIELMRHWREVLPHDAMLELRYEDMVADTEHQARRLLDYLGLPWNPRCLAFHENKRVVRTASAAQVRRPVYRSSVARWKHFEPQLKPLLDIVQAYRQPH